MTPVASPPRKSPGQASCAPRALTWRIVKSRMAFHGVDQRLDWFRLVYRQILELDIGGHLAAIPYHGDN